MAGACVVAVVHGAAVLAMLTGALLALRRPRVLLVHVPVSAAILAVNLAGAPCPLTRLELALRAGAGVAPYHGGFLGHYVFTPLGLEVGSPAVQAGIYAAALVPNAVGYGLLAVRAVRRRRSDGSAGPFRVDRRADADTFPRERPFRGTPDMGDPVGLTAQSVPPPPP